MFCAQFFNEMTTIIYFAWLLKYLWHQKGFTILFQQSTKEIAGPKAVCLVNWRLQLANHHIPYLLTN